MDQAHRPHQPDRQPDRPDPADQVRRQDDQDRADERPQGRVALEAPPAGSLFPFVQFEFPWNLGPEDGRYVLRGHAGEPSHVIAMATLGAQQRWLPMRRKPKPKQADAEPDPAPVYTTRVTIIGVTPFDGEKTAKDWLRSVDVGAEANVGADILNDVLHAHRTTTADPFVREVSRHQALIVRVGIGDGERVAEGRWLDAREVETVPQRPRGSAAMRPQERLAALLGGRDVALACEELTIRARLDLDRGRLREAALQLRVALEAAIAELTAWLGNPEMADRIEGLRAEREAVGSAANRALQGGLDDSTAEDVGRALRKVEAALRARTASGLD